MDFTSENINLVRKPGAWEMGADGTLTIVATVKGTIHRIRITPPADSSVDTFLASARR